MTVRRGLAILAAIVACIGLALAVRAWRAPPDAFLLSVHPVDAGEAIVFMRANYVSGGVVAGAQSLAVFDGIDGIDGIDGRLLAAITHTATEELEPHRFHEGRVWLHATDHSPTRARASRTSASMPASSAS